MCVAGAAGGAVSTYIGPTAMRKREVSNGDYSAAGTLHPLPRGGHQSLLASEFVLQ